jgi:hypothetical protein
MDFIAQALRLGLGIGSVSTHHMMTPLSPVFIPIGGFISNLRVDVVIDCANADTIYYTLDGSQPDGSSSRMLPGESVRLDFSEHEIITLRAVGSAVTGTPGIIYGVTLSQNYTYRW